MDLMKNRPNCAPAMRRARFLCTRRAVSNSSGQATVEMAVMLPAALALAVIVVNALLFFSDCAAFDRAFRNAVRVYATSPAYDQDVSDSCALVEQALASTLDVERLRVDVEARGVGAGHLAFTGTLSCTPSLFGRGAIDEIFGVRVPQLVHRAHLTIDQCKPGVIV